MKIGILALQGSVIEHRRALERLGVEAVEVRSADELKSIDGIILPGGESTVISKLLRRLGLFDDLKKRLMTGLPAWGTCAGAILLAKKVIGAHPPQTLGVMDIEADRNAYGPHKNSFEAPLDFLGKSIMGIFIRAPKLRPLTDDCQTVVTHNGNAVMIRQKNLMATAFHPELTDELGIHRYFLELCKAHKSLAKKMVKK